MLTSMADIPRMLGLQGVLCNPDDQKIKPMPFSENLCAASMESLMQTKDGAEICRGPMRHSAICRFVGGIIWGELDYTNVPIATMHLIFSAGGGKTAASSRTAFLGKIPIDPEMVKCGDAGICYLSDHSSSKVAEIFTQIVDKMTGN